MYNFVELYDFRLYNVLVIIHGVFKNLVIFQISIGLLNLKENDVNV